MSEKTCIIKEVIDSETDEDKVVLDGSDSGDESADSDYEEEEEECEEENPGIEHLFQHFLVNEDGENIADVLAGIKQSMDIQNKILVKLLGVLSSDGSSSSLNQRKK